MNLPSNPYQPPMADSQGPVTAVVPSRQSLAELINSFLASEITAFKFDEQLDAYRESDDPVVRHVADAMWYHYDDCDDHLVCLAKPEWDYIQRLLLVLASDCRVETKSEQQWSVRQLIAALSLVCFLFFAVESGWGRHLLVVSIPFGVISMTLSYWPRNDTRHCCPYAPLISPFASFSDLEAAYRSTSFRKTKYPGAIRDRTIRSPFMSVFWQLHSLIVWLILAPLPLLFQALPETRTETRVVSA